MLRNVAKTAPYFHDGSVERLDSAVRVMAEVQLGRASGPVQAARGEPAS
jgi:cytochrome c peroxidase